MIGQLRIWVQPRLHTNSIFPFYLLSNHLHISSNIHYYNSATWYDWTIKNWGTTSLAYKYHKSDNPNELDFLTAWKPAKGIIGNLSKHYPELTFTIKWADEDFGENCGTETYQNGKVVSRELPHTDVSAVDFAADIWQMSPAERGLVLNLSGNKYICEKTGFSEYFNYGIFVNTTANVFVAR